MYVKTFIDMVGLYVYNLIYTCMSDGPYWTIVYTYLHLFIKVYFYKIIYTYYQNNEKIHCGSMVLHTVAINAYFLSFHKDIFREIGKKN